MKIKLIFFYIIGMGFSNIGKWMYLIAINLKILSITNSPYAIAIFYIIGPAARLLTNLWNGSIIDSYNKKTILVSVDIFRFLIIFLVFFTGDIWLIYFLTFILGIGTSFFSPASNVFIVNNIEQKDRKRFNAIMGTVNSGAMLTGPALAGIIIAYTSMNICILITSILFLICAICISIIPNNENINSKLTTENKKSFVLNDFYYVISFFRDNKQLMMLFILFYSATLIGYALDSQEATYIKFHLESTNEEYGFLVTIAGIGSILGSIFNVYTHKKITLKHYIGLGSILGAIGYMLFYVSSNIYMAGIGFLMIGFFLTFASIGFTTFFQNNVPVEKMGRVGTISDLIQGVIQIVLTLVLGYLSEIFSLQFITVIFAGIGIVSSVILYSCLIRVSKEISIDLS